ncbi:hypothetical protein [Vibrio mytili]|uniref:hypothetical protein n=1 Tax=Vibrio mytili TaxID=50718 RepID=UPI002F3E74B0
MTQEEINKAVSGIMELRPTGGRHPKYKPKDAAVVRRMSEAQFKKELEDIMQDQGVKNSVYFFKNNDSSKKGRKNIIFNRYKDKSE